jgi:hypothetical protein
MTSKEKKIPERHEVIAEQPTSFATSVVVVLLWMLASGVIPVGIAFSSFGLACAVECNALPWIMFLIAPILAIAAYLGITFIVWKQAAKISDPRVRWLNWFLYAMFFLMPILAYKVSIALLFR